MNEISFTGIRNFSLAKKTYKRIGPYLDLEGTQKFDEKNYLELPIKFDLFDDSEGSHLSDFMEALNKSGHYYTKHCVNPDKPNHVELFMKQYRANDDMGTVVNSNFKINGFEILLNHKQVLPIFSYMAKITRELANMPNMSEARIKFLNLFNKSVEKSAVDFIENG